MTNPVKAHLLDLEYSYLVLRNIVPAIGMELTPESGQVRDVIQNINDANQAIRSAVFGTAASEDADCMHRSLIRGFLDGQTNVFETLHLLKLARDELHGDTEHTA